MDEYSLVLSLLFVIGVSVAACDLIFFGFVLSGSSLAMERQALHVENQVLSQEVWNMRR